MTVIPNERETGLSTTPLQGKRILHISLPLAPDIRADKENQTYRNAGAKIATLVVGTADDLSSKYPDPLVNFISQPLRKWRATLSKVEVQARFDSFVVAHQIRAAIRDFKPDLLHVHNMFIARPAQRAAGRIPVVLDLHENDPGAAPIYRSAYPRIKRVIFASCQFDRRIKRFEKRAVDRSQAVITVTEEATSRVETFASHQRIFTVPNFEVRDFGSNDPRSEHYPTRREGVLNIVYVGGFGPHRGLETLVRGVGLAAANGVSVHVDLIGAQESDFLRSFRAMLYNEQLMDVATLHDWIPTSEVASRIRAADLCAVPHDSNAQTEATLPHKLFQYMALGKPVLTSSCAPLRKHIDNSGGGFVFNAGEFASCADVIQVAASFPSLREFGESARKYVETSANWEQVSGPSLVHAALVALNA